MPAIDLSLLPPVAIERIASKFTDPTCPGVDFAFEFGIYVAHSESADLHLSDLARRLEDKYVAGNLPIDVPGGARVPIERTLCLIVAMFVQAENTIRTECAWQPEDWFRFSLLAPTAFRGLQAWYMAEDLRIRGKASLLATESSGDEQELQAESSLPND